ncbi:MAG: hypothetical protein GX253_05740 [Synergistaceae bacterium]|mgnify:CR=1 FL=1|jgi:hypothetical protein|nr:hypothetical protein [Synergistaceae bacterium]
MLSLVRSGPESLVLHATDKVAEIKKSLNEWGSHISLDPERALGIYGNNRRIIFFISSSNLLTEEEEEETYVSENSIELLLCTLINRRLISGVEEVKMMPGFIMMRLLGNIENGIASIHKDLGGEIIDRDPMFRNYIPGTSSVVYFTQKAINRAVSVQDMYEKALLIHHRSKGAIIQYLSVRGIEYLGDAMGTPDWNDVEIKIYDANGHFDLHRQRLWMAAQGLQIGVVLAERWGRDQAMVMMSVPIYLVKIFTPMEVQEIKRIAMGLEYNEMGQRFADFDVFFRDKKVSAYTELESHPGMTRNEIGMLYRNEIMKNIDFDSMKEMLRLESIIKEKSEIKSNN